MSNTAIEVITSVQRRRRWSAAEKERLVAASLEPGSGVSAALAKLRFIQANCTGGDGSCAHARRRQRTLRRCGLRPDRRRARCLPLARLAAAATHVASTGSRLIATL